MTMLSTGKLLLIIAGYFLVAISLIPLIRLDNWIFRIFEYPRFQKLVINIVLIVSFLFLFDPQSNRDIVFLVVLGLNLGYLIYQVWPYTVIGKLQMQKVKHAEKADCLSILICNVFQDNHNSGPLLEQVQMKKPDLLLVVEVDAWWAKQLMVIHNQYPYRILNPLENTYGMCLYSKLPVSNSSVKFLIEPNIPSIHTLVELRSGRKFRLYGLHPEPPVPQENPRSTERDAEILLVAKDVKTANIPVIVAGDLNDVAWSYTTGLFLKISGLLDPRRGRGFFSTFHSKHRLLRWPLDHVFCSNHFSLIKLERLPDVGSDHFPIFISIQLTDENARAQENDKLEATDQEEEVADEKIARGKQMN